jgi:hypothetical protein
MTPQFIGGNVSLFHLITSLSFTTMNCNLYLLLYLIHLDLYVTTHVYGVYTYTLTMLSNKLYFSLRHV